MRYRLGTMLAILVFGCAPEEATLGDGTGEPAASKEPVACNPWALPCGNPCKPELEGSGCGRLVPIPIFAQCLSEVWVCCETDAGDCRDQIADQGAATDAGWEASNDCTNPDGGVAVVLDASR